MDRQPTFEEQEPYDDIQYADPQVLAENLDAIDAVDGSGPTGREDGSQWIDVRRRGDRGEALMLVIRAATVSGYAVVHDRRDVPDDLGVHTLTAVPLDAQ